MILAKKVRCQKGFLLAELICAIAVGLVLTLFIGYASQAGSKYTAKIQLRGAAKELAANIGSLQHQALFCQTAFREKLYVKSDLAGYSIVRHSQVIRDVDFSQGSFSRIRFTEETLKKIWFQNEGAPIYNGNFVLTHQDQEGLKVKVGVQPVTGRIVITEEDT